MPHVYDQYEAGAGAVVPHLVLEAIVENEHLAFFPLSVIFLQVGRYYLLGYSAGFFCEQRYFGATCDQKYRNMHSIQKVLEQFLITLVKKYQNRWTGESLE